MLRVWSTLEIPCPYPLFERIKLELAAMGGILTDTEYGAEILLHVIVPQSDAEALLARIVDVSNGRMAGHITRRGVPRFSGAAPRGLTSFLKKKIFRTSLRIFKYLECLR